MTTETTRRSCLRRLLGLASAGLLAGSGIVDWGLDGGDRAVPERRTRGERGAARLRDVDLLQRLLPRHDSAGVVGRAYLRERPGSASVEALLRELDMEWGARARRDPLSWASRTRDRLRRCVRRDFESGRTVVVDGWVLSVTEARLAALAALAG